MQVNKTNLESMKNVPWKMAMPVAAMAGLLVIANLFSMAGSGARSEAKQAGYWPGGKSVDNAIEAVDNTTGVLVGASRVAKKGADIFLKHTERVLDKRDKAP